MARQYLLAIDGGGVRGIVPLCLLVALERATGRLTRETFSFVAGTSAGAIIAAGVAAGIPAAELLARFEAAAGQVFAPRPWHILNRLVPGYPYSTAQLHAVLRAALGPAADWTMNEAPINLLVTAVRLADGKPWYFVRDNPRNSGRTGHLPLVDCITASAAAPTFFAPWTIPEPDAARRAHEPIGALVDGGVSVTGNPVYQACVEAFYYTQFYTTNETVVVSLGTGRYLDRRPPRWIGAWLAWLLAEMLRSPGEQQTEIVRRHFPHTPCYRLDPALPFDVPLDRADGIPTLRQVGELFAATVDWTPILAGAPSPFAAR